jgi:hypothetical protein
LERHRQPSVAHAGYTRPRPHAHAASPPQRASLGTFVRATAAPAGAQSTSGAGAAQVAQPVIHVASSPPQRVVSPPRRSSSTSQSARAPVSKGSGRPAFGPNGLLGPGTSPNS